MSARSNLLSQDFAEAFICWFNSDLINIRNHAETISLAEEVVTSLVHKGTPPSAIIEPLTYALDHWSLEVIDEFSYASDTNWSFDADTENLLKDIIREMIAVARSKEGEATALNAGPK